MSLCITPLVDAFLSKFLPQRVRSHDEDVSFSFSRRVVMRNDLIWLLRSRRDAGEMTASILWVAKYMCCKCKGKDAVEKMYGMGRDLHRQNQRWPNAPWLCSFGNGKLAFACRF